MGSTLTLRRSEYSVVWLPAKPSAGAPYALKNDPISGKQAAPEMRDWRAMARFLAAICIGVIATLAWQSYSNAAKQLVAGSSFPVAGLARIAETSPNVRVSAAFAVVPSPDQPGLAAVWQDIDQLATSQQRISLSFLQLASSQEQIASAQQQMMRDITRLQQNERHTVSASVPLPRPAPAETRKHASRPAAKGASAGPSAHHAATSPTSAGASSSLPTQLTGLDAGYKRTQSTPADWASEPLGQSLMSASRDLMSTLSKIAGIQL
jgi:TolA-binding protein